MGICGGRQLRGFINDGTVVAVLLGVVTLLGVTVVLMVVVFSAGATEQLALPVEGAGAVEEAGDGAGMLQADEEEEDAGPAAGGDGVTAAGRVGWAWTCRT